jgi:hypothetical protein
LLPGQAKLIDVESRSGRTDKVRAEDFRNVADFAVKTGSATPSRNLRTPTIPEPSTPSIKAMQLDRPQEEAANVQQTAKKKSATLKPGGGGVTQVTQNTRSKGDAMKRLVKGGGRVEDAASIFSNTVTRYDATKSIREDFADVIYNISPTDCPLMSNIGRDTAKQTYTEWQTDALATAVTTNAVIEGDDAPAADTTAATNRVGNYTQISRKIVQVSGTVESVGMAGIKSMLGYQMAKKAKELKRDMEPTLNSDQVAVVGNSSTARKASMLGSWIITNWYQVATGGSPAAPTMSSGTTATRRRRPWTARLPLRSPRRT